MPQFTVNTSRIDPYTNFKFRVKWDGQVDAGVSTPRHSPASSKFDPITLERGVTFAKEFRDWATLVYNHEGDGAVSLKNFRKDITIELLNLQGTVVKAYNVFRCWVSEFTTLPELDGDGNSIA